MSASNEVSDQLSDQLSEACQNRLTSWIEGLELPPMDDERRRLEELCLGQLRNFFLLLLCSRPDDLFQTPVEALDALGPSLDQRDLYHAELALPLKGSPDSVVSAIALGDPAGELFALQEKLTDELQDEGRLLLVRLGRLF